MDIDTNIDNYSISELIAICSINDPHNEEEIKEKTNFFINKYNNKNTRLFNFFNEIQYKLLNYNNNDNKSVIENFENKIDEQINNWYTNEALPQDDKNQYNKITNRVQKIQTFDNGQIPMKREQIATTDTFNVPIKQDSLNPNLKNIISRFINLDSQFRQYSSGPESISTDYNLDLSDTLKDALSLRLYSYQIPYSWYTIDNAYGNNCFWIIDTIVVPIMINSGNYSQNEFIDELKTAIINSGFTFSISDFITYNKNSGIITFNLYGGTYNGPLGTFNISENTQIFFYDFNGKIICNNNCYSKNKHFFNNTLGWLMGFRLPYINVSLNGNSATCILDLNGPKYLILVIDDYNQNHVNNSLISISQFSNTLKIPSYYSPDLPYTCLNANNNQNNLSELMNNFASENSNNGLLLAGKFNGDYSSTQIVLPSAPRTLTNSQLYTINSINNNNNNLTNFLSKAPTSSDILAIIPVKTSTSVPTGSLLVEFAGSLQDSVRTYFGPVNIDRMAIKLLDDKGNILNLNGSDWCVTLVCDCLYQY